MGCAAVRGRFAWLGCEYFFGTQGSVCRIEFQYGHKLPKAVVGANQRRELLVGFDAQAIQDTLDLRVVQADGSPMLQTEVHRQQVCAPVAGKRLDAHGVTQAERAAL